MAGILDIETLRERMDNHLSFIGAKEDTPQKYHLALGNVYRSIPDLEFSRPNIEKFIADLRRKGYKSSVVRFHYFFLRSLVENVLDGNWPFKPREAPPEPTPEELFQPIFSKERIKEMIVCAKRGSLDPPDITRFAVSTVYGGRRIELAGLGEGSFDKERKLVRIETRKRGEPRTHIMPDEIIPYVHPEGLEPISKKKMSDAFEQIEEILGFEHQKGYGWHSIRRRIITYFDDRDVSEKLVHTFLRWKRMRTIRDRYVVRDRMETDKELAKVDMKIFEIHPFLPAWAQEKSA